MGKLRTTIEIIPVKGILFSVLLAIVFFAPRFIFFGTLTFVIVSIISDRISKSQIKFQWYYAIYILYYLLYLVALIWTEDIEVGVLDLERKLLFLAAPLLFTFIIWKRADFRALFFGFTFVVTLALVQALMIYSNCTDYENGCFSNAANAGSMHHIYMSMYATIGVVMAISILLFELNHITNKRNRWLTILACVIMSIEGIILCYMIESKAGILGLGLAITILLLIKLYRSFSRLVFLGSTLLLVVAAVFGLKKILEQPIFQDGIEKVKEFRADEAAFKEKYGRHIYSNTSRILVWDASIKEVKKHPFGVGPGDMQGVLLKNYEANNYFKILERKLNPHNQYMHVILGLGVQGLLVLLVLFFHGLIAGIKRKNPLFIVFSIIVLFNALFESILELQVGVFFFVMFALILDQISLIPKTTTE